MTTIGTNLRAAQADAGLTNRALGAMAGVGPTTISSIVTGRLANPGVYTLYGLAIALGVRMEDLMGVPRVELTTKGRSRVRRASA